MRMLEVLANVNEKAQPPGLYDPCLKRVEDYSLGDPYWNGSEKGCEMAVLLGSALRIGLCRKRTCNRQCAARQSAAACACACAPWPLSLPCLTECSWALLFARHARKM